MSEVATTATAPKTQGRIPVRNLWHMLLYAWELGAFRDRFSAAVDDSPTLIALVARLLTDVMERRLRRGLARGYEPRNAELDRVRGRIDVVRTEVTRAPERGRVACRFESYEIDIPRNRIIRSTLAYLARSDVLHPRDDPDGHLRARLRHLVRRMEGISIVAVTRELLRRQDVGRNDPEDRLILSLCDLVRWLRLPTESTGPQALQALDRETMTLHAVYERFVARFYESRLKPAGWKVRPQSPLKWQIEHATEGAHELLPGMKVDIALRNPGKTRRIIVDTKFTNVVKTNAQGREVFSSPHLYQIYAYLRSQDGEEWGASEGLLLYPAVSCRMDESVTMHGHRIRFATVDLAAPWSDIEAELIKLIS